MAQVEMRDVIVDDDETPTTDVRPPRAWRHRPPAGPLPGPVAPGPPAPAGVRPPPAPASRPRHRWSTRLAGALAVLLLAAVVVEVRQERALAARLDATAGLLGPLDPSLVEEVWRMPGGRRATLAHRGGLVVMTSPARETLVAV